MLMRRLEWQRPLVAWMNLQVGADQIGKVLGRRRGTGNCAGEDVDDAAGWLEPCGTWQFEHSSATGACPHRNGPRFSAWQV